MTLIVENIPTEICDALQRLHLQYQARKSIITQILQNNEINVSSERFKLYNTEMDDYHFAFQKMQDIFQTIYVNPCLDFDKSILINWKLDYFSRKLYIYYKIKEGINTDDTQI